MKKKTTKKKTINNQKRTVKRISNQEILDTNKMLVNSIMLYRQELAGNMLNRDIDMNYECRYPDEINIEDYKRMYDRNGLSERVVKLLPEESWAMSPVLENNETSDETAFEKAFSELNKKKKIYQYLQRVDVLSGIGEFGILLLGINDGKELDEPVDGINEKGEKIGNKKYELLYLKAFDQSNVKIVRRESDVSNPRYSLPIEYSVDFETTNNAVSSSSDTKSKTSMKVHWTRVIHVADNRQSSEVLGVPRMQSVYNALLDARKILCGSGEMFWKGAFPGTILTTHPDLGNVTLDTDSIKKEVRQYSDGLQRHMAFTGVDAKQLEPQVVDPTNHFKAQLLFISITLGIPLRMLMGSEEAKLASSQDSGTWNKRIDKRRKEYVSPLIIEPFIERCFIFGILPEEEYQITWPDLNTVTDSEKAETANTKTEAMAKYVAGSVDQLMEPKEYLMYILGYTEEEASTIFTKSLEAMRDEENGYDDGEGEEEINK